LTPVSTTRQCQTGAVRNSRAFGSDTLLVQRRGTTGG
jgi:hypothetical protein